MRDEVSHLWVLALAAGNFNQTEASTFSLIIKISFFLFSSSEKTLMHLVYLPEAAYVPDGLTQAEA